MIQPQTATIERGGVADEHELAMIVDKESMIHVLSILRNSLYSDKIGSPIREYASNAFDAHTEAGIKERPIEIDLPTTDDPFFRVTDFGKGLTETEMEQIFRRFGKSTKRTSNEQIGCLGIGAKSAFAYTDAFSVISRTVRGTHRAITRYSVYLDETKMGRISILERHENPEALTGLTIEIPVQQEDAVAFHTSAFQQLQFFKPQPIYRVDKELKVPSYDGEERRGEFGLELSRDEGRYKGEKRNYLVMGGVGYPLIRERVRVSIKRDPATGLDSLISLRRKKALDFVLGQGVILRLPLGAVEIDASREGLSYTPATIRVITIHCLLAYRRFYQTVNRKVQTATTYLDASFFLTECKTSHGIAPDISYGGRKLKVLPDETKRKLSVSYTDSIKVPPDDFEVNYEIPKFTLFQVYNTGAGRCFIPILNDLEGKVNSLVGRRTQTAMVKYSGTVLKLLRIPKTPEKYSAEPIGTSDEQKATVKKAFLCWFLKAYGNYQDKDFKDLTIPDLLSLFQRIGGALLSEFEPAPAPVRVKGEPVPRAPKAVKLALSQRIHIWNDGKETPLEDFKEKLTTTVIYWQAFPTYTTTRKALRNPTFCLTTRQFKEVDRIHSCLLALEQVYPNYQFCFVFGPIDEPVEAVRALLPTDWLSGPEWLIANFEQLFPPDFRYVAWEECSWALASWVKEATIEPFLSIRHLIQLREVRQQIQWLMSPPYYGIHKTQRHAEEDPKYLQARRLVAPTLPVSEATIPIQFPLLANLDDSKDAIAKYVELVLNQRKLEERIAHLEAQIYASTEEENQTSKNTPTAAGEIAEEFESNQSQAGSEVEESLIETNC